MRSVGAAMIALMFGCGAALAASAENGKKVYMAVGCWGCHGTVGQGGVTGPKVGPDPAAARHVRVLHPHHQPRDAAIS